MSNEIGLAKSAPQPVSVETVNHPVGPTTQVNTDPGWEGVPMPVLRYFNIDFKADSNTLSQVRDILQHVPVEGDRSPGAILEKLSNLEMTLGSPRLGETRHGRLYNYLKMQSVITDLQKQQRSLINGSR